MTTKRLNFGDGVGSVTAAVITPRTKPISSDEEGSPAPVKQVTWTTTDPTVLVLTPANPPSDDFVFNESCKIQSGAVGKASMTCTTITESGATLSETVEIEVVADQEATSLGLTVG